MRLSTIQTFKPMKGIDMKKTLTSIKRLTTRLLNKGYKNVPNQPRHFVNDQGEVISVIFGRIRRMKLASNDKNHPQKGYYFFRCYKGSPIYVHKLVYMLFKGPIPEGYQVHHISGNTAQNNIENLTLLTRDEHRKLTAAERRLKKANKK